MHLMRSGRSLSGLLLLVLLQDGSGTAQAAIITYVESGTLSKDFGPDGLGLNGASFALTEVVDSASTPITTSFNPITSGHTSTYNPISTSMTITGASVSSTNGTYTNPVVLTVTSRPTGDVLGFGINFGGIGGENVNYAGVTLPFGTVPVTTHALPPSFTSDLVQSFSFFTTTPPGNNISFYYILNGASSGSVAAVPEPSSFVLAVLAIPGLATIVGLHARRRRRAAQH